ncbi:unnamed protein product [Penicillium salamii]|uniref:Uncharacterized protein n=1 Tax=Penicillium salamii TaxID=1612424 RepID=A0A9W4JYU6_9EURO|nr:unnamed protein product [Penicillium salamii]CAG7966146.1 unnamed protein product [Penicillium salamii]CAG8239171.1 unnamed protein product [Penicillium salamii]CAG8292179.1 unnamed protein product [Penicillium salamii]CAG8321778.1 unnamed protein product [Penicillium salamii]
MLIFSRPTTFYDYDPLRLRSSTTTTFYDYDPLRRRPSPGLERQYSKTDSFSAMLIFSRPSTLYNSNPLRRQSSKTGNFSVILIFSSILSFDQMPHTPLPFH